LAAAEDLPPHQIADRDDAAVFLLHRTDELGTHEVLKNINLDMNIKDLKSMELWFVTGSQHLYGEETLKQVADLPADCNRFAQGAAVRLQLFISRW
jgi:hypothetical protein